MRSIPAMIAVLAIFYSFEIYAQNDSTTKLSDNINDIVVKDTDGSDVKLSEYRGKVLLIVNTASKCGYTPQLKGLQELYEMFKDRGFEVLAFPCNDFGGQEPLSNEEIKEFCETNYGVTFKIFDKVKILGDNKSPLYQRLTNNRVTARSDIKWNFEKFIIAKDGRIVARLPSMIPPMDDMVWVLIDEEIIR